MNAPVVMLAVEAEAVTPVTLGVQLFEGAQRKEVALSDAEGCAHFLRFSYPGLSRRDWRAARRVAIDLQGQAARHPHAALVRACRSAVALAEDIAGGTLEAQPHAVLAQITDLLDGALALTSD